MASRKPDKRKNKPLVRKPEAPPQILLDDEGRPIPHTPHPLEEKVIELQKSLETVNRTLIERNGELDAAKAAAERLVFKDVVVLTAMLDAKAYLASRGGVEAAIIIQRIANAELRLGSQALDAAVVLQKIKNMVESKRADREIFPEEYEALLKSGERLL